MSKVRDTAIDALKGFLILLVVLAHNGGAHPFVLDFAHPAEMGMFFMVSGYLIHGKLKIKKRVRGTILPFMFFISLSVCWRYIYGFVSNEPMDFERWGRELLLGENWSLNIPMWFLLSYVQLLLLVYCLNRVPNLYVRWVIALVMMLVGLESMWHGINPIYMGRTLEYLPFFMIGDELHHVTHKFPQGKYPFITMLLIGVIIWGRLYIAPMDYYMRWFVDSFLAVTLAYLLYNLLKSDYIPSKIFAFYGRNSIVVLCMHILILDVVWRLWWHQFGQPDMTGALIQTATIALLLYPCCEFYSQNIGPRLK